MKKSSPSSLSLQSTIESLLRATGRENVEQLLTLMRDNGYYRAGCHRHHKQQGGLAHHSLEVLLRMQRQNDGVLPTDSIIIVSLLHDLCNIHGFHHIRHHGYRSIILATREAGFKLRTEESQAILWHMHGPKEKGMLGASFDAVLDSPLWQVLRKADHYSAAHPLTGEELAYAMEGKPRRVASRPVSADKAYEESSSMSQNKAPRRYYSEEEKRHQSIKRNNASIADIFEALYNREITVDEASDMYRQQYGNNPSNAINNKFFCAKYLDEHPDMIDVHRAELADRCYPTYGAAKRVARYIYEETDHVFNWDKWKTTDIYDWLKSEFAFPAERFNFYKACEFFTSYTNRK